MTPDDGSWVTLRVLSNEFLISQIGSAKNRRFEYRNGETLMVFSKYFFDRPSAQGFKRGLGINIHPGTVDKDYET